MTPDTIRHQLAEIGKRRQLRDQQDRDDAQQVGKLAHAGKQANVPMAEMARLAGYSRNHLYDLMRDR